MCYCCLVVSSVSVFAVVVLVVVVVVVVVVFVVVVVVVVVLIVASCSLPCANDRRIFRSPDSPTVPQLARERPVQKQNLNI